MFFDRRPPGPYVANVVGERNYGAFCAFLLLAVLAIGLHVLLVFPQLAMCGPEGPPRRGRFRCALHRENAPLCAMALLAALHLVWVFAMLVAHSTLACHDQTTYESIRGTGSSPSSGTGPWGSQCTNPDTAKNPVRV